MNQTVLDHLFFLLENLPQMVCVVFVMYHLGKPRMPFRFLTVFGGILLYAAYLIPALLFHPTLGNVAWNIVRQLSLLIFQLFFFYGTIREKFMIYGLIWFMTGITAVITNPIFTSFFDVTYEEVHYVCPMQVIGTISFSDIQFMFSIIIVEWNNRRNKTGWNNTAFCTGVCALLMLHFLFICFFMIDREMPVNYRTAAMQLCFQYIIMSLVISYFDSTEKNYKMFLSNEEQKRIHLNKQYTHAYYQLADRRYEEISHIRHDLYNQINTINDLIACDHYAQAKRSLSQLQNKLEHIERITYCENPTINSVMALKTEEGTQKKIETDICLKNCVDLPFENYDLCSLFSNLFDNALEECERIQAEKSCIRIRSMVKNGYFVIKFSNTTDRKDNKHPESQLISGKGKEGHGLGLSIVQSIVAKYHGHHNIYIENGMFTIVVYLAMESICEPRNV